MWAGRLAQRNRCSARGPRVLAFEQMHTTAHTTQLRPQPPVPVGPPSSDHLCSPALTCPAQNGPTFRHPGPPTHLFPPLYPLELACKCVLIAVPNCMCCLLCMLPPPPLSDIWVCACGHASRVVMCFQALPALCRPPALPSARPTPIGVTHSSTPSSILRLQRVGMQPPHQLLVLRHTREWPSCLPPRQGMRTP